MGYERITLDFKENVAVLTFNHPEVLNAVSMQMLEELKDAMDKIEDPALGARCLLLTGTGRGFCAGAHLGDSDKGTVADKKVDAGEALEMWYNPLFIRLRNLKMPFITAVNGPAAGVGMSFALMGDLVLAARSAYFLQAFSRIGLIPDGGSTYLLPRMTTMARAMELSLLAEKLPAEKALEWGLINRVHDDDKLMEEAFQLAGQLAQGPTVSLGLIRRAHWLSVDNSYEQQLYVERVFQKEAGLSRDFGEGVQAFFEKRPARFQGK